VAIFDNLVVVTGIFVDGAVTAASGSGNVAAGSRQPFQRHNLNRSSVENFGECHELRGAVAIDLAGDSWVVGGGKR
jgi:hypothetical protein